MSIARKANRSVPQRASRRISSNFSRPSWEKPPRPYPSRREIEVYCLRLEVDFQKREVERVKSILNFKNWAIAELVSYLDAELKPGQLTSWGRYRRLVSRLKTL